MHMKRLTYFQVTTSVLKNVRDISLSEIKTKYRHSRVLYVVEYVVVIPKWLLLQLLVSVVCMTLI